MGRSVVIVALFCLQGVGAANILRGNAVKAASTETHNTDVHALLDSLKKFQQNPQTQQQEQEGSNNWVERTMFQLIFGVAYYFLIVSKYPMLDGAKPTPEAIKIQELDELSALFESSMPNCLLSWCCTGPRAAHTFHSAGVLDYWPGCILMSCFPCCTLWIVNSFTDLNERLGGEKRNFCIGALCACFCSCCIVAQDAQSLDHITGMETGYCGVEKAQ